MFIAFYPGIFNLWTGLKVHEEFHSLATAEILGNPADVHLSSSWTWSEEQAGVVSLGLSQEWESVCGHVRFTPRCISL